MKKKTLEIIVIIAEFEIVQSILKNISCSLTSDRHINGYVSVNT